MAEPLVMKVCSEAEHVGPKATTETLLEQQLHHLNSGMEDDVCLAEWKICPGSGLMTWSGMEQVEQI